MMSKCIKIIIVSIKNPLIVFQFGKNMSISIQHVTYSLSQTDHVLISALVMFRFLCVTPVSGERGRSGVSLAESDETEI